MPRVTHFRLAASGLPGTPTLLSTTTSGAGAARSPPSSCLPPAARPRPPGPPSRIQEGWRRRPLPPSRPARQGGRAPRSRKGAAGGAAAQGGLPSLRLALLQAVALLSSGSLSTAACLPPGSLRGRCRQLPRPRGCSRGALLRFSSGIVAGAGR